MISASKKLIIPLPQITNNSVVSSNTQFVLKFLKKYLSIVISFKQALVKVYVAHLAEKSCELFEQVIGWPSLIFMPSVWLDQFPPTRSRWTAFSWLSKKQKSSQWITKVVTGRNSLCAHHNNSLQSRAWSGAGLHCYETACIVPRQWCDSDSHWWQY